MSVQVFQLSEKQVQEFLPHRDPLLFVDQVLEISAFEKKVGSKMIGIKTFTSENPVFQGHFPGAPVLPGVYILETMAQVAGFSMYPDWVELTPEQRVFSCSFVAADKVRFRAPVFPNDTLRIEAEVIKWRKQFWIYSAQAWVGSKKVAEAEITLNLFLNVDSSYLFKR